MFWLFSLFEILWSNFSPKMQAPPDTQPVLDSSSNNCVFTSLSCHIHARVSFSTSGGEENSVFAQLLADFTLFFGHFYPENPLSLEFVLPYSYELLRLPADFNYRLPITQKSLITLASRSHFFFHLLRDYRQFWPPCGSMKNSSKNANSYFWVPPVPSTMEVLSWTTLFNSPTEPMRHCYN